MLTCPNKPLTIEHMNNNNFILQHSTAASVSTWTFNVEGSNVRVDSRLSTGEGKETSRAESVIELTAARDLWKYLKAQGFVRLA